MKTLRLLLLLSAILPCFFSTLAWGQERHFTESDIKQALKDLDAAVEQYPEYEHARIMEIERKKAELQSVNFTSERYLIYKQIQALYRKVDSDSSLRYANLCLQLAEEAGRKDWLQESILERGTAYTLRGNLNLARRDFVTLLPIDDLPGPLQIKIAYVLSNFYRLFVRTKAYQESPKYKEDLAAMDIDWEHLPEKYLSDVPKHYYRAKVQLGIRDVADIPALKELVDKALSANATEHSTGHFNGYSLAQLYLCKGDTLAYKYYLIRTAEQHIKEDFKCAEAMLEIISSDWIREDPVRAYNYVTLFASDIAMFQDMNRAIAVITAQQKITGQFIEKKNILSTELICISVVLLMFLIATIVLTVKLIHRVKRIKELNGRIGRRNKSLADNLKDIEQMHEEVKISNRRLHDEIKLRDGNFMDTYLLCSDYIKIHQNFKKTIANLLKTGSTQQAIRMATSRDISDSELREFYQKFDRAFLSTHPDFIERFNRILQPDSHYAPELQELTPELRIYALISMGINNSVNIAEFLHYSAQTIYNYRLRMRHQASIPEKVFAEAVGHLYEDDKLKAYFSLSAESTI